MWTHKLLNLRLLTTTALVASLALFSNAQQPSTNRGKPDEAKKFVAAWTGALDLGAIRLRLVFNVRENQEKLVATLDSPDQGAKDIPLDEVRIDGSKINIESKKIKAAYDGTINSAGDKIEGTWTQNGREFQLSLTRAVGTTERNRPQTPREPFPYRVEEVSYPHESGAFKFAATITIPNGNGQSAAAILISGSGAQDRDESIFEHKPFAVLADHLTKAGMVVLRVDDRGVGGTGNDGSLSDDTSADFATDVRSALSYLRSRQEVDRARIGLIGHSEGALIAPMVAADDREVAFLVLLAGPGVPGDELLLLQTEKIARTSGASQKEIESIKTIQSKVFSIIRNQPDIAAGRKEARAFLLAQYDQMSAEAKKSIGTAEAFADQHSSVVGIPWFRYFITLDPKTVLAKVECPVMSLYGEKDLQVPPEQNQPKIEQALTQGKAKDVTSVVVPGLNHLLQTSKSGLVTEYGEIEETISPLALAEISKWLKLRNFAR